MPAFRDVRLKSRPAGAPTPGDFEMGEEPARAPAAGEVQVRNRFLSVDPYMRGRMSDRKIYVPPFELGKVMQGGAVGEVVASADERFREGDRVLSMFGWREGFTDRAEHLQKLPDLGLEPQHFLGAAGMPGMTAYFGLLEVAGGTRAGETVFVSAASGAVGQVVCQIARLKGARVVGSAGGPEKCAFLREIGCDAAIDYRATDHLTRALAEAAPQGVDVYFDNVGGGHLQAALEVANPHARFAECGMIEVYNNDRVAPGPSNMANIVGKRLRIQGFIVTDFMGRAGEFYRDMGPWIASGAVKTRESVDHGIEAMPGAFMKLFTGENFGKMLVAV